MFLDKKGYYRHKETKVMRSKRDYSFMSTDEQAQFDFIENSTNHELLTLKQLQKLNYETENK